MDKKITPQIAAMYLGQNCDVIWAYNAVDGTFKKGDMRGKSTIHGSLLGRISIGEIEIIPYLRPLDSITEEEAREIYKMVCGKEWQQIFKSEAQECKEMWLFDENEFYRTGLQISVGNPSVWLHLLGKGFDLFGLISAGLAIDITAQAETAPATTPEPVEL